MRRIDLCYTNIEIPGVRKLAWGHCYSAASWSALIRLAQFDAVRDLAIQIYSACELRGIYVPKVTLWDSEYRSLQLEFDESDGKKVTFFLSPNDNHEVPAGCTVPPSALAYYTTILNPKLSPLNRSMPALLDLLAPLPKDPRKPTKDYITGLRRYDP